MAYIGLDVGTTGCKATVVDQMGQMYTQEYAEYDLQFPAPGHVELDPRVVWDGVKHVLRSVASAYDGEITALSIASFGEAVAMLDKDGQVLGPSIFYTDVRGYDSVSILMEKLDRAALERRTGMPVNGMYTLMKLIWQQNHQPEQLKKMHKMLPFGGFIGYCLTGEAGVDQSLASRMLMFDQQTLDWDSEVLDTFHINRDWLPRFVPAGQVVGQILPSVAAELGLSPKMIVVSGVHDQIAAALGAGALHPGQAEDGIGGAECIAAVLPDGVDVTKLHPHNICKEPHAVPGEALALIFNSTAGASLKWYRDTFETELLMRDKKNAYNILNESLSDSPSPLLFLPYLASTGTPYMDGSAKGMITGLALGSTRADLYRAIIEGMNYEMRFNLELLAECGMRYDVLTAVGGGASSDKVLQIKADIYGCPIRTLRTPQSGTVGLSMLCGWAEGHFANLDDAAKSIIQTKSLIEPSTKHKAQYDDKYQQYKRMYQASKWIAGE
ncbi:hypothetical protein LJC33_08690 [Eubacteriales bacterium OttesenSCG-928-N13]|nr:hypothetical protein [Eubacteriales bacterium OttesenSCG-928-N13]